jgi:hypothetical protein
MQVSVADPCRGSGVPEATVLRCTEALAKQALVEQATPTQSDPERYLQLPAADMLTFSEWLRYRAALPR